MPTLNFKGKQHIYAHHLMVPHRPLVPDFSKSVVPDADDSPPSDDNLIIHGDNLQSLKALLPRYAGRINCIYIDPPYNTGNEGWAYNDNVNSPLMQRWLKENGPVDNEDMERHDKWLCMMWPRLHLLRELLSDNGGIIVSIDDNELHHLRLIMDEIFGEENFRNIITVRRGVKSVQAQFEYIDRLNSGQEYMVFYSKTSDTKYRHLTTHKKPTAGTWNNHWRGSDRPTLRYELLGQTPKSGQWRWKKERSLKAIQNYQKLLSDIGPNPSQIDIDEWWFMQSPSKLDLLRLSVHNKPEHYIPPSDRTILSSLWNDMTVNEGYGFLETLDMEFDNPKRVDLIRRIVEYLTLVDNKSIVLDSFAGSGTTAHAVLKSNKEDNGNRKFILVECEDYADSVTAERVRRIIKGVPDSNNGDLHEGLGGSFTYCTLGDPIDMESMLSGEHLPSYSDLASFLLHTASGISVGTQVLKPLDEDGLFYTDDRRVYYLLYKPDVEYLKSNEAMLNDKRAKVISSSLGDKKGVVFAAGKFLRQSELSEWGITFCQVPYQFHRIG